MKLSEAMFIGIGLRPESHDEERRFCITANDGILRSDAWGAACEAVQPGVAKFNWMTKDPDKFKSVMDAFCAVQDHYFPEYWQMPAQCPGANRGYTSEGASVLNRQGNVVMPWGRARNVGAITSECDKVEHMAGMVDHLFYAHGWSRENVQQVVEWYENTRSQASLVHNFQHYQSESLRQAIHVRLSQAQFMRAMQRRKRIYPVH